LVDSLFSELKRRNVFRVCAAYLAGSWLFIEVADTLLEKFGYNDAAIRLLIVVIAIGLVPVLIFAWVYEFTSDGLVKESEIVHNKITPLPTNQKLDFLIIGLLVIGMGYFIWESRFEDVDSTPTPGTSIAVMPFVNMSSDPEQEYFSDGISEEILNLLAKIPNLLVTSRSSAFAFKGSKINISEVARNLGVRNVLEGSVRKSGNQIRITAQLIDAKTDIHLWSETYDRELTVNNIFAIQDEISGSIVKALQSKLGVNVITASRDKVTIKLEAHNEYLQGRFFLDKRTQKDLEKALTHFKNAIAASPDYALAWMGKAWASSYLSEGQYGNIPYSEAIENARTAAEKSLLLDPNSPEINAVMGLIESHSGNGDKAENYYRKSIELNPNNADAHMRLAFTAYQHSEKKIKLMEKAVLLDPMSLLINHNYSRILINHGRLDEAKEIARHMKDVDESSFLVYVTLYHIKNKEGKHGEATFNSYKAYQLNPHYGNRIDLITNLANIGLPELIVEILKGSSYEFYGLLFTNQQLYIDWVREHFPTDNEYLGEVEVLAENYHKAVDLFTLNTCGECNELIFSYLQVGDYDAANPLIDERKKQYANAFKSGEKYLEIPAMEIAFLENDIDKAIEYLHIAMVNGYIIHYEYRDYPMYNSLREHPDWPALLAESDRRAAEQREIYLKLVAQEEKTSL
jgi:TolB-like protein